MKLDCVLTACDTNPRYYGFIPYFISAWHKLYPSVDVKIVLIHDSLPQELQRFEKNIIVYKPLENVSTGFTTLYIRLLYPCVLNYSHGVMITDIDNIPLSLYFTENIKDIADNKWIYLRDWQEGATIVIGWHVATPRVWRDVFSIRSVKDIKKRLSDVHAQINYVLPKGWHVATPRVWRDVFSIRSVKDIKKRLSDVYARINYVTKNLPEGWHVDQLHLYQYVMKWHSKTGNYISLRDRDTGFHRLDRADLKYPKLSRMTEARIKKGFYSDYHCLRPYEKYKSINDRVLSLFHPVPYKRYNHLKRILRCQPRFIRFMKAKIKIMLPFAIRILR